MSDDSDKKSFLGFSTVLIYVLLFAGLATAYMPMLEVKSPPIGSKSFGVSDLIKSLPKSTGEKKDPIIKVDYDFMDILKKILPKNSSNEPKKFSLTFILGVLVPVALALTYFLLVISLLVAPIKKGPFLSWVSGTAFFSSAYSLVGIFYLGLAAEKAFEDAVEKASGGLLGVITKNFIPELSITPDMGAYVLTGIALATVIISQFRRHF